MSKPQKTKAISPATQAQILEAAWALIAAEGRPDAGLAEIAARAAVSRQTVFYAFGSRSGVLTAMVRHQDTRTAHVARIQAAVFDPVPTAASVVAAVEAWLDYLPVIYPVGILLDAASLTDEAAAAAWRDRMVEALLGGFKVLLGRVHARSPLGGDPGPIAEEIWAEVHPTMWRRLVVECGWAPAAFRARCLRVVEGLVGA
ncbi:MAG: TetR/AcrR family transcriptional regulator [Myxococcales bacterium]|nr:TetR/AcrR family transcriptional regulator [Myxococcales bacterium]